MIQNSLTRHSKSSTVSAEEAEARHEAKRKGWRARHFLCPDEGTGHFFLRIWLVSELTKNKKGRKGTVGKRIAEKNGQVYETQVSEASDLHYTSKEGKDM